MIVKRGILRNSAKSDDCDAARRALGIDRASNSSVTDNTRLELGTIYTENPLHEGQSVVPNSRHDAGDTDSLLTRRIEQQEQRAQQQEQRVQQHEQTINEYSRRTEALEALIHQHLPQVEQPTISVSSISEDVT